LIGYTYIIEKRGLILLAKERKKESIMKEKFARFMQGRYGVDQLGQFLNILLLVLILVNFIARSRILDLVIILLFIFGYSRMFSRNYSRCTKQNQWFLTHTQGIRKFFGKQKAYQDIRKDYHIYKCKQCGQKIKIPKGKGKIIVTCPKCGKKFQKKS
jgi:DNA-directed RNA polymerase subunit RPC12/RpoP